MIEVKLPSSICKIDDGAFFYCSKLSEVIILAEKVPDTHVDAFKISNIDNATLRVPSSAIDSYKKSEPWNKFKYILKPEHIITYIIDGEVFKNVKVEEDATITPEQAPTKNGYKFSGWVGLPETMPNHDITVTGTFTLIPEHTLTYILDGEIYKTYQIKEDASITPEVVPDKEGYTFSGWKNLPETMPDHDVVVTGNYSINSYKITYEIDGEVYQTEEVEYKSIIYPPTPQNYEGFEFNWADYPESMPAHDIIIHGSYKNINSTKIILYLNNGDLLTFSINEKPELSFRDNKVFINTSNTQIEYLRSEIKDFRFEKDGSGIETIEYIGDDTFEIYDVSGHLITIQNNGSLDQAKRYINSLKPGLYIIKIGNNHAIKYLKK